MDSGSVAYISKMLKGGDVFWDGSVHSGGVV